jgi:hypothetical protein
MDIDLSCLFDEHASQQPHQQQYNHMGAHARGAVGTSTGGDSGDLYDLARDIMNRHARVAIPETAHTSVSPNLAQYNILSGND